MTTATRTIPSSDPNYERNRRRQVAYGRWEPYVDAEAARAHVRQLMAYGIGWMRTADLAGLHRSTVEKLLYGSPPRGMEPSRRIRAATATRLLAVRPEPGALAGSALTDATGTHRRLRALSAAGWPQAHLAGHLGMHRSNFVKTMQNPRVLMSTERAARTLYDQLWNADPREHGVTLHSCNRARNHAQAHRWAPAGAWDDDRIDDPTAFPDWTGRCGTAEGYGDHYAHHIPPCDPCRTAQAARRREKRAAA